MAEKFNGATTVEELANWQQALYEREPTDVQLFVDTWLEKAFSRVPENKKQLFFANLDKQLIYLHTLIHESEIQSDAKNRIITTAKIFDETITQMKDIRSLPLHIRAYIAEQQVARHRLYSLVQGGVSGSGGVLFLGVDIPALFAINIKAIQLIGMSYGYEMNSPYEMIVALKVFQGATLPKHLQRYPWAELMEQVESASESQLFYEGNDEITNEIWFEQPIKQGLKAILIFMMRKKLVQGIPLFGMVFGATANYKLTKQVTDYAHRFYQGRGLLEQNKS